MDASFFSGASAVITALGGQVMPAENYRRLDWDAGHLIYAVREPFPNKTTGTRMVFDTINNTKPMTITSHMKNNGVIFW